MEFIRRYFELDLLIIFALLSIVSLVGFLCPYIPDWGEFLKHLFIMSSAVFAYLYAQRENRLSKSREAAFAFSAGYADSKFKESYKGFCKFYESTPILKILEDFNREPNTFFEKLANNQKEYIDKIPESDYVSIEGYLLSVFDFFEQMALLISNGNCDNKILFDFHAGTLITRVMPCLLLNYARLNKSRNRTDLYENIFELYNCWVEDYNINYNSRNGKDKNPPKLDIDKITNRPSLLDKAKKKLFQLFHKHIVHMPKK
jgi:hypothetical protein